METKARQSFFVILIVIVVLFASVPLLGSEKESPKFPVHFLQNCGQMDDRVLFSANGPGSTAFFTSDSVVLDLCEDIVKAGDASKTVNAAAIAVRFLNPSSKVKIEGIDEMQGKVHYLVGNDRSQWKTDVNAFRGIAYRDVWPGIDVVYRGQGNRLKYDILVSPNSDVSQIKFRYEGAQSIEITDSGDLRVVTAVKTFVEEKPVIYQEKDGSKVEIDGGFTLEENVAGFEVNDYDPSLPLIIDPASDLIWSALFGGSGDDFGQGITVDQYGFVYVTGSVGYANYGNTGFPTTAGAYSKTFNGGHDDAFVAKLTPSGNDFAYCTYLGGSVDDYGRDIAIDSSGCAYIFGYTESANFPTTSGAFDVTYNGPSTTSGDMFITKLSPSGSSLVYSTFLGGSTSAESVSGYGGIAVDAGGYAYVAGYTGSADFPTTPGAYSSTVKAGDIFVTKFNPSGTGLVYSTFIGGTKADCAHDVAIDASGCAYVTGYTTSTDFPTTPGAFDTVYSSTIYPEEIFVTKLNQTGSALMYSTYLGAADRDVAYGIAVDSGGCAYVTGSAASYAFPTTPGAFDSTAYAGFITKFNPEGSGLVYSTCLDGGACMDIAIDSAGCAYVTGSVSSSAIWPLPATAGAYQTINNGAYDIYVVKVSPTGNCLLYSTMFGASNNDHGNAIAVDTGGNVYVTGGTMSSAYYTTPGAVNRAGRNNWFDILVTKWKFTDPLTISGLKMLPDTTSGVRAGGIVTLTSTDYFYMEADDRSSGIRVSKAVHGLPLGARADAVGTLTATVDGERSLTASAVSKMGTGSVKPVGINNMTLGGGDWIPVQSSSAGQTGVSGGVGLNNIGLLVRTWGRFRYISASAFEVEDGSGVSVRCEVPAGVVIDQNWQYVAVTGVSSCYKNGLDTERLIRVRTQSDIKSY